MPARPRHDVGIHIHGVDRVRHGHHTLGRKQLLKVAHVGLGPVADKNFVRAQVHAARLVVIFRNNLAQKGVALFRTVPAKKGRVAHFVHSLVQGFDDGGDQRTGHVAYAQADDAAVGVGVLERGHLAGDVREKIVALELEKITVDRSLHGLHP